MRRTGRSTRLVDKYIQELFTTGLAVVLDHHHSNEADYDLLNRVAKRMSIEHSHVLFVTDKRKCTITLIKR